MGGEDLLGQTILFLYHKVVLYDVILLFQIMVNWVFFQVSIAVLLDNFLTASNAMKVAEYVNAIEF